MNVPNKITVSRLFLAPVFFIVFSLPNWMNFPDKASGIILLVLFVILEFSDIADGMIARKYNLVTDLGKVLDPFADIFSRMTYFICFVSAGIMPMWMLLILLYRELGITFARLFMTQKGITMAASGWGKLKAVSYAVSGIVGLFIIFSIKLSLFDSGSYKTLLLLGLIVFGLSVFFSVFSFITYLVQIRKSI